MLTPQRNWCISISLQVSTGRIPLLIASDGKCKMQALFEKDERLIFKRFEKICLLSKQISMKTSLWDFSSL